MTAQGKRAAGLPGVYIHIPFCRTRCAYCDYVSNALEPHASIPDAFINALVQEIKTVEGPDLVGSVFIGGGTPSLLTPAALETIIKALHNRFRFSSPEITMEVNPDDVSRELVCSWQHLGINRVSMGAQSFDNRTLQYLGRRHTAAKALKAVEIVGSLFDNWSLDLIFGAPPRRGWNRTLAIAADLRPPHISTYALSYEPGTPLFARAAAAFDEDDLLDMYQAAEGTFVDYNHYEISNFARPGYECRHNLIYWKNETYLGLGPGAYAYHNGKRMRNEIALASYLRHPGKKCECQALTLREQQIETLIQHFRLRQGISKQEFETRFGPNALDAFMPVIQALEKRGLLRCGPDPIRPTAKGFYLNNELGLALVDAPAACLARPSLED